MYGCFVLKIYGVNYCMGVTYCDTLLRWLDVRAVNI